MSGSVGSRIPSLTAGVLRPDAAAADEAPESTPARRLMSLGEWPFVLGRTLPWLAGAEEAMSAGLRVIETTLLDDTDTDGTPCGEVLREFGPWVASLLRAANAGVDEWSEDAFDRLHFVAGFAATVVRADGSCPFSDAASPLSA